MSQPTPYARQFGFTDFEASFPASPAPGTALDAEFDAVKATFIDVLANLAKIQRDDGALKNQIVTLDALSPAVMFALGAGVVWLPRGAWVTGTVYSVSDVIQSGTASYVCAIAHTSAALLATDVAAGRWVKLFDDAGATPGDGSVTAAKLADGSVTTAKIGFTGLDLSGSIRAATGLQAGIAPLGALMHAKLATGDVFAKTERATDAQGAVGYKIIGAAATWTLQQATAATGLSLRCSLLGADSTLFTVTGGIDQAGTIRATNGVVPTAGAGAGLHFASAVGYLTSYDYDASAWRDMKLRGLIVYLTASGVDVLAASATGVDITGTVKRGGVELGWLDTPQNVQSAAYTLVLADRGKHIYSANVAGQTIIIPTNASVAFPIGATIAIVNDGSNPITISTTSITLKLAGTASTGNRTLAANGLATLLKVGTDRWFITGAGIS